MLASFDRVRAKTPKPPIPSNYEFLMYGDSRGEDGISATFGAGGYAPSQRSYGFSGWLPQVSNGRLRIGRYGNFSIAGGNSLQGVANPRQSSLSTVTTGLWYRGPVGGGSGSDNKGWAQVVTHSAGIFFLLMGTNGDSGGL